eukprot:13045-Heterococcus_DN1.PRE.2
MQACPQRNSYNRQQQARYHNRTVLSVAALHDAVSMTWSPSFDASVMAITDLVAVKSVSVESSELLWFHVLASD